MEVTMSYRQIISDINDAQEAKNNDNRAGEAEALRRIEFTCAEMREELERHPHVELFIDEGRGPSIGEFLKDWPMPVFIYQADWEGVEYVVSDMELSKEVVSEFIKSQRLG